MSAYRLPPNKSTLLKEMQAGVVTIVTIVTVTIGTIETLKSLLVGLISLEFFLVECIPKTIQ